MVQVISKYTIGEAWIAALKLIISEGVKTSEDKGVILEVLPLIIEIISPPPFDDIIARYGDMRHLEFLAQNFQNLKSVPLWGYSYAQRLYNTRNTNPIAGVITALNKNPASKSAAITLLDPAHDQAHVPCLALLDFKIRNSALIINAVFRSQDIGKKMYGDALELLKLGTMMVRQLPAETIILISYISSAHIYNDDLPYVLEVVKNSGI